MDLHRVFVGPLRASILILALGNAGANAEPLDATTGRPAIHGVRHELPYQQGPCQVLWDLTHGVYFGYQPEDQYSNLATLLAGASIAVTTTSLGIANIDLSSYDVIVICLGSSWDSPYTPAEVAALQDFQSHGGGLLVLGDNTVTPNSNINPVAQSLGTTCGVGDYDLYFSNFSAHEIFGGISSLYYRVAGTLDGAPPSQEVAFAPTGEPTITLVEMPRAIVLGDINIWDNSYLAQADNSMFALNVFHWLCAARITPARKSSWGQLKALYR